MKRPLRPLACLSAAALAWAVTACEGGGGEAEPAPAPPASRELPSPAPRAPGLPDPAEPGISDLARVARYVFRAMQENDTGCAASNPFTEPLRITLAVRVEGGSIVEATLAGLALERGGEAVPLEGVQWPPELVAWATCMEPLLRAIPMTAPVADGSFETVYRWPGTPDGRAGP